MKSRITIEVDFGNNNLPIIQILHKDSDDVRDKLVSQFIQSLAHTSRWCKILYLGEYLTHGEQEHVKKWTISPMLVSEISDEIKLMETTLNNSKHTSP